MLGAGDVFRPVELDPLDRGEPFRHAFGDFQHGEFVAVRGEVDEDRFRDRLAVDAFFGGARVERAQAVRGLADQGARAEPVDRADHPTFADRSFVADLQRSRAHGRASSRRRWSRSPGFSRAAVRTSGLPWRPGRGPGRRPGSPALGRIRGGPLRRSPCPRSAGRRRSSPARRPRRSRSPRAGCAGRGGPRGASVRGASLRRDSIGIIRRGVPSADSWGIDLTVPPIDASFSTAQTISVHGRSISYLRRARARCFCSSTGWPGRRETGMR